MFMFQRVFNLVSAKGRRQGGEATREVREGMVTVEDICKFTDMDLALFILPRMNNDF